MAARMRATVPSNSKSAIDAPLSAIARVCVVMPAGAGVLSTEVLHEGKPPRAVVVAVTVHSEVSALLGRIRRHRQRIRKHRYRGRR